jgi:hypothetical protein
VLDRVPFNGSSFGVLLKLEKNTTVLVQNVPRKCSPLGLWTAARLCAKNNKFDVILHQFPDDLERTFLHNRTAGCPSKTMCHFLPAVTVFNMGLPEHIHRRLCLTWAYICKKFDVILHQFPDDLERTFLHNRTAGCPSKTMVSVTFCQL